MDVFFFSDSLKSEKLKSFSFKLIGEIKSGGLETPRSDVYINKERTVIAFPINCFNFCKCFTFISVKTRFKLMKILSSIQSISMPECKKIFL